MPFDGNSFVMKLGPVWNDHDVEAVVAQFTEEVVLEVSLGPDPPVGGPRFAGYLVDLLTRRDGKTAAKRSCRKMRG